MSEKKLPDTVTPVQTHVRPTHALAADLGIAALALAMGVTTSVLAHRLPGELTSVAIVAALGLAIVWRHSTRRALADRQQRSVQVAEAQHQAETDSLTGCHNRHSINAATDALVAASAEGDALAVISFDIDNFKRINNALGHGVGDAMLAQLAHRISALLPAGSVMARLGGDEFACVIAYPANQPRMVDHVATAIVQQAAAMIEVEGAADSITISAGLAHSESERQPGDSRSMLGVLLHRADIALYQAKKSGQNRYLWFAEEMEDALRHRCDLEAGIRGAIANDEFTPYYQPVVELKSNRLVAFEMLARWQSPRFGLVEPADFIAVAEDIGAIASLSEKLIIQALREAREWRSDISLSVNISPVQVRDPWFAQKLLKLIHVEHFPRNRLEIEISETCLHGDLTGVTTLLSSLKNQGISLCLDDYGMGFCSLYQLRSLRFDRIKLHRGLISTMATDKDSHAIVESVLTLGRGLDLPITAEGIDTHDLLDQLRTMGSARGQGYIFGEPQAAEQTRALITRYLGPDGLKADSGLPSIKPPSAPPATDVAPTPPALRNRA